MGSGATNCREFMTGPCLNTGQPRKELQIYQSSWETCAGSCRLSFHPVHERILHQRGSHWITQECVNFSIRSIRPINNTSIKEDDDWAKKTSVTRTLNPSGVPSAQQPGDSNLRSRSEHLGGQADLALVKQPPPLCLWARHKRPASTSAKYAKLVTHAAASSCHVLPGGFHGDTRARSNRNVWCLAQRFHEFDDQLGQYCQYLLRNCVPSLPNSLRPCQTFSRHISVCLHFSLRDGLNQTCSRYVMTRVFGEEASAQWHN